MYGDGRSRIHRHTVAVEAQQQVYERGRVDAFFKALRKQELS
jgi:hypothetical protein